MKQLYTLLFIVLFGHYFNAQITLSTNNSDGCTPLPVSIQVTSPDAGTISSYAWEITFPDNSVVTANSSSYTANFSQAGTYDITLTINGNETETFSDYITVYDIPIADFVVNLNIGCYPLCVELTDNSTATDGAIVDWDWDFGDGNIGTGNVVTECYQNPGLYSPFLSITDANGCFSDISMPGLIDVSDEFPTADFTASSLLDCNSPVAIDFTNSSTGFSDLTSNWDFGDGNTSTTIGTTDQSNTFANDDLFEVCLQVIDEIGCENSTCQEITIFETADAEFTVSETTICQGQGISFQDETVITPMQWEWDFDGNGTVDSNLENPSFVYPAQGNYSPELTIIYSDNCQDTQIINPEIEVLEQLIVDFEADTTAACSVPFDVEFTNLTTGGGNLTYNWVIDGVSVSTDEDLNYTFNDFGSYNVSLTTSNDVGCTVTEVKLNYITIAYPTIDYSIAQSLCAEDTFEVFNVIINSVDDIDIWNWDFDNNGTIESNSPEPEYTYPATGDYTVSLDFVTENGCVPFEANLQEITISEEIFINFALSDTAACAEDVISFCAIDLSDDAYGLWDFGDGGDNMTSTSMDSCIEYHYQDTGYFDISLSIFNNGCVTDTTLEDAVYILGPVAKFDPIFSCNDQLTVTFSDNSLVASNLIWDFGDTTDLVYDDPNPSHTYAENGTYTITLTAINDSIGCEDEVEVEIIISNPNPELIFSQTSGCPPFDVVVAGVDNNPYWFVDFGNGTTVEATLNAEGTGYNIVYFSDGITQNIFVNDPGSTFFPDITYDEVGVYDVTVSIVDENGCIADYLYDDLIEVNSSPDFASFQMEILDDCETVSLGFTPDLPNLVDISWTFNNGETTTDYNPIVEYVSPYPAVITATLTAADSLGCVSIVTEDFIIVYPTVPSFTIIENPICGGDSIVVANNSTGDIISYSWDFGDPGSGDLNTSDEEIPSHTYYENGTYDVCLATESQTGCVSTFCIVDAVTINNPTAEFTVSSNVTNCNYGVSFVNTSAGTIDCSDWDFGDDQTGIGMTAFHTYSIGVYDVELIICNEFGCVDTLIQEDILNFGDIVGPFSMELDEYPCAPFTVDFEAYNIADNTFDYFWDFDNGSGDPGGNTTTSHDYQDPGTYCPSLIMTDPNGCSALITCEEPFVVEEFGFTMSEISPLCIGDSLLFTVSGGETYTWADGSHVTTIDNENYWLHPDVTFDFELNATLSDCETTEEFSVIVNELPVVTFSIQEEICHYEDTFTLSGGLPNDFSGQYFVDGVEQIIFDPSWTADQSYTIIYSYTDVNNCTNSTSDDIFINALPEVTILPFEDYCEHDGLFELIGATPVGGQYLDQNNNIITNILPADYLGSSAITYEYTDNNNCYNSASENILVSPNPTVNFTTGPACAGDNLTFINASTIFTGIIDQTQWLADGVIISTEFDPAELMINESGDIALSLTLTSDFGCISSADTTIHVSVKPIADFSFDNGCQNTGIVFQDNSTSEEGIINAWSWHANSIEFSTEQNPLNAFDNWGYYSISLTVTSDAECSTTIEDQLEVFPSAIVDFNIENNCFEETSVIINQTIVPVTNPTTIVVNYNWSLGDGTNDTLPYIVEHEYLAPGSYEIVLEARTQLGCLSEHTDTLIVYALPEIEILASDDEICQGADVDLSSVINIDDPYSISSMYWTINGVTISSEPELTYTIEFPTNLTVELGAYSDAGCFASVLRYGLVTVFPTPEANFTFSPQGTTIVDPNIHFEDLSTGGTMWNYTFGDGYTSQESDPEHTYLAYDDYTVIQEVSNDFGCSDTTSSIVRIEPFITVYVPNTFTPDGDGVNEFFMPVFSGFEFAHYDFVIYDKWGVLMFSTDDPTKGWNGTTLTNISLAKDGIYNWKMEVSMPERPTIEGYRGSVNLMR